MNFKEKGYLGEEVAAEFLRSLGYEILEQNYTIRGGEIDIIAVDGATLVFVEVKSRTGREDVAAEAVDAKKIERLVRSAERYILDKSELAEEMRVRFDCIEVYFTGAQFANKPEINHYKNIDVI